MDKMNTRLRELLGLYLDDRATQAEQEELWDYVGDPLYSNELQMLLADAYQKDHVGEEATKAQKQAILDHIFSGDRVEESVKVVRLRPGLRIKSGMTRIIAVAAAVAAVVLGIWFYSSREIASVPRNDVVVNDIAPGKNGATITLANGQVIALSGEKKGVVVGQELKYSDGSIVGRHPDTETSSAQAVGQDPGPTMQNGIPFSSGALKQVQGDVGARDDDRFNNMTVKGQAQMLTASTAKGQTYEFTLPDGTKVWLNADSKISFPSQFNGAERRIELAGEAYFAVVHNAKQPFRVQSRGQVVEDIGTEFNINAYGDEVSVRTTLVEGSARVNDVVLKPNQQAVLANNSVKVTPADIEAATAWKGGKIVFHNESLKDIMRSVARWYDVEVVYEDDLSDQVFGGSLYRTKKISSILNFFSETGEVNYRIEGRKVILLRK